MPLSEPRYLLLLAAVCAAFYVLPKGRPRAAALLAASYMFYVNLSGLYALVLFFVTAVSYFGARFIAARKEPTRRGRLFAVCCAIVLAPLIILKYSGFLLSIGVGAIAPNAPLLLGLVLPIGLSFFTFVALGYVIDVHLGVVEPEMRPIEFALFLAFFPLVTAGPIERAGSFLPQFDFHIPFQKERAFAAVRLIFYGMFLKVCLANSLLGPINTVLDGPRASFVPEERVCALVYYMAYIYADFAGYSLIAIGSAKLFGLEVRANFQQPYLSTTIPDFWRRWHISLSSWVRDYLFTPMRMSWRRYRNLGFAAALMLSFLVIGIWHGAGWTFLLFGLMHGTFALASTYTLKFRDRIWQRMRTPAAVVEVWRIMCTNFLVLLTLIPYRAGTLGNAWPLYHDIFRLRFLHEVEYSIMQVIKFGHYSDMHVITPTSWTWLIVAAILVSQLLERRQITLDRMPAILQIAAYNVGGALIVYGWIAYNAAAPFLYYRF